MFQGTRITDIAELELQSLADKSNQNWEELKDEYKIIMAEFEPEFEQAALSTDEFSLDFLRDRVVVRLGRSNLRFLADSRAAIGATITGILRTIIRFAIVP